jgi:hypothetical protein
MTYLRQLAIAFDQFANALLWGWADETLSARAFRAHRKGRAFGRFFMPVIDLLFFWQKPDDEVNALAGKLVDGHCERAFYKEILRRDHAPEYR